MSPALAATAEAWWGWMAPMTVQVAILAGIVAASDRLLARWTSPQQRSVLWLVVLLKLVVPPTLGSPVSVARAAHTWAGDDILPVQVATAAPDPAPWVTLLFVAWLAGAAIATAAGAVRLLRARRRLLSADAGALPVSLGPLVRDAAIKMRLRRLPLVHVSASARGPAVVGLLRPRIVLPASLLAHSSSARIEHVLLHETAHIKRRDPLSSAVGLALQLAYWFHPAAWLACRRLAVLRELACDQAVARRLRGPGEREEYRRTLLAFAERLLAEPAVGGVAFARSRSQILARLAQMEAYRDGRANLRRGLTLTAASLLLACCLPMGPGPAAVPPPPGPLRLDAAGCLRLRFEVLRMMALQQAAASGGPAGPLTPDPKEGTDR